MFFDETGWGRAPREPAPPRRVMTERQERILLRVILANVLFMLIAPIGGGTVIEGFVALFTHFR